MLLSSIRGPYDVGWPPPNLPPLQVMEGGFAAYSAVWGPSGKRRPPAGRWVSTGGVVWVGGWEGSCGTCTSWSAPSVQQRLGLGWLAFTCCCLHCTHPPTHTFATGRQGGAEVWAQRAGRSGELHRGRRPEVCPLGAGLLRWGGAEAMSPPPPLVVRWGVRCQRPGCCAGRRRLHASI